MQRLVATTAAAAAAAAAASKNDTVTVTLSTSVLQPKPVSDRFVGFSIEVGSTPEMFAVGGLGGPPRKSYPALMNLLREASGAVQGPNIRVGGNSADESVYLPSASDPLPAGDTYRITDADLALYAAAVPLWNGTLTLDLNLRNATSPALAVAHAVAAGRAVGWPLIESLEIGNEVDLFSENGIRPASYGYPQYDAEFRAYAEALGGAPAALPPGGGPFLQGATWCTGKFDADWAGYLRSYGSLMRSISYHRYPETHCHGKVPTLDGLMADAAAEGVATENARLAAAAAAAGVPMHVGEGNSVSCGGYAGVSDVFGAALWAADALVNQAAIGVERWNFHGSNGNPYAAVTYPDKASDAPTVLPLFYGLWLFAAATRGRPVLQAVQVATTNPLVKAYALADAPGGGASGGWRVLLLHKDPSPSAPAWATVSVVPPPGTPVAAAAAAGAPAALSRLLPGPNGINATAADAITWAGQTLAGTPDGVPQGPVVVESVPPGPGGVYAVALPRASAALLELPGGRR